MLIAGSMFSGIGLLDYGLHLAGIEHAWFCEADPWRRGILAKRWPGRLVLDDVRTVGVDAVPGVDLIAGGFPCKGASTAGKRTGFDHPETVLWREMARAVRELRPRYVLVENVANILALHDGAVWGEVLGDLAACGYDVRWDCLPAGAVGAPHLRDRVFAVACLADVMAGSSEQSRDWRSRTVAQPGAVQRSLGPDRHAAAAADAPSDGGQAARRGRSALGRTSTGRGVAVEWGAYEPAIRHWEAVHGPAPEPLVRRVDDRGAARVERSRLSALGDGVQVQVGRIVGEYIVELERQRCMSVAA